MRHRACPTFWVLCCGFLPPNGSATAQSFGWETAHATDATADRLFALNPAIVPRRQGHFAGIGGMRALKDARLQRDFGGGNSSMIESKWKEDFLGIGGAADLGGGARVGFDHMAAFTDQKSKSETQRNEQGERFAQRTYSGRLGVALAERLQAALSLRYTTLSASVLGNMFAGESRRTNYSGTTTGLGGGLLLGTDAAALSVAYLAPARGRAVVIGENKVLEDPGHVEIAASFSLAASATLGVALHRWLQKRDDRDDATVLADGSTQIEPRGLSPDATVILPYQAYLVGLDLGSPKGPALRLTVGRTQSEWIDDSDKIPVVDAANLMDGDLARVGMVARTGDTSVDLGASYHKRTFSRTTGGGATTKYLGQGRSFSIVVGKSL